MLTYIAQEPVRLCRKTRLDVAEEQLEGFVGQWRNEIVNPRFIDNDTALSQRWTTGKSRKTLNT